MFIKINNLCKYYGTGENQNQVLKNINFNLEEGKICAILGPSGSGKSTFANIVGGIDAATSGEVTVNEENITKMNSRQLGEYRRNNVGFIFQFYNLIPNLTVYENIEVVKNLGKDTLDIDDLLRLLGIDSKKKVLPDSLSGGQQQRVAIGRALVKKPKLLICDEPTGALDSKSSKDILNLLCDVNKRYGTTILMITHNEDISKLCDTIIKIKDGIISERIENKEKKSVGEVFES